MTGEPLERKPWTSSWELPPIHTLAPKFRWSVAGCPGVGRVCEVRIPKDGRGTMSGSADAGGFVRGGALGRGGRGRAPGGPPRCDAAQPPLPLATLTLEGAAA